MIQKALEYIVGMRKPEILRVNGEDYSDKPLNRISYNPKADAIHMNTLSSLIEYIKKSVDEMQGQMIIHVQSPTHIEMYSQLDSERKRECVVVVDAQLPEFRFGQYVEHEPFCINLQSKFIDEPDTDRALLLKFAGTVEAGTVAQYGDDGVTQKATIKTGIASKGDAIVPNPVTLKAFRTFVEVPQPVSQFIFRIKQDKYDGIQCALFEADGGAWRIQAMDSIRGYLMESLKGFDEFIVIS
jgi:hypothetical protein